MQTKLYDDRVAILTEDPVHMWVDNDQEIGENVRSRVCSWGKMIMKRKGQTKKDFENKVKEDYNIQNIRWR